MKTPAHLYKYEAISLRSLENLKTQTIFFGSPLHFNDPYDCALTPSIAEVSDENIEKIRSRYLANNNLEAKVREQFVSATTAALRIMFLNSGQSVITQAIQNFLSTSGVSCFSETNNNLLMWSHYGGHCKGICLEFDTSFEPFEKVQQVIYKNEMPSINLVPLLCGDGKDEHKLISDLYCTKSRDWGYEREWRCIHKVAGTAYYYPAEALTNVYFGPDIPFSTLEIVCLILAGQNEHVRFWRGKRSLSNFSVEFEPFTYTPYLEAKQKGLL